MPAKQSDLPRILFILLLSLSVIIASCGNRAEGTVSTIQDTLIVEEEGGLLFGIDSDSFIVENGIIAKNEFLADILLRYNVDYAIIHNIAMASKDVFDVRRLARGKPYTLFCTEDSMLRARIFVYQPNDIDYVVYDFSNDSVNIYEGKKPVMLVEKEVTGTISSSLYEALQEGDQDVMLAFEMADIFAWTIDFYRLQKGDHFKIIYDVKVVEEKAIGIEKVKAVKFNHEGRDFFAYHFEQDSTGADYFDEAAQSLRKAFLKSPLKFSRLTSGYTRRRFHPVQKRWKAHLGTDYAAPIWPQGMGKLLKQPIKNTMAIT